jgi:hypothetical protein
MKWFQFFCGSLLGSLSSSKSDGQIRSEFFYATLSIFFPLGLLGSDEN